MRKYGKIDDNQPEIVRALRKAGCAVQSLAAIGNGCPDLLVSRGRINYLLEVKDGSKSPSERRLTPDQVKWWAGWQGPVSVVETSEQALYAVGTVGSSSAFDRLAVDVEPLPAKPRRVGPLNQRR